MTDYSLTSNLSLKKPNIGGSDGKWGEYLNENLETIGAALVSLQNASTSRTLESLSNVLDLTPTSGQLLQFSGSNWSAQTVAIPDNIQDLANVTISSPSDGQVLAYSISNSRWENQTPGAATIPDGTITNAKLDTSLQGQVALILQTTGTPTDNQIVRYDSTSANWQFEDLPGGTVAALSDTDVSAIANKDVLVYNSTSGNWVSRPLAIADVTNLQTSLDAKLETADVTVSSISDTTISSVVDDSFLVYDSSDSKWKNEGPSTVRSTLSLVVGTNVQAQSARLDDISSLAITDGNFIVGSGTGWVAESGATVRTSLGLGDLATQSTITESQISDLGSYLTASSTDTLTNKSGNVSMFTNDAGYLTAESNDLSTVSGTLGTGNGGTGLTSIGTANQVLAVNSGATALEFQTISITESQISDFGTYLTAESNDLTSAVTWANVPDVNITQSSVTQHQAALSITESQISDFGTYLTDVEHSNSISTAQTISSGQHRMYVGPVSFSNTLTIAGKMLVFDGLFNQTSGTANITGLLKIRS